MEAKMIYKQHNSWMTQLIIITLNGSPEVIEKLMQGIRATMEKEAADWKEE